MSNTIKTNDVIRIKKEWQDAGDDKIVWIAIEDQDGNRVRIQPQLGLTINPNQVVNVEMIEKV